MGMYTELHFNSALRRDTPAEIIAILEFMTSGKGRPPLLPNHPLFQSERWEYMLHSDSYYFDADTVSTLRFDDIAKSYYLCIRCNLKNYDNEIKKFIDWVIPHLDKCEGAFLGFSRYEEMEIPTLIYYSPPPQK